MPSYRCVERPVWGCEGSQSLPGTAATLAAPGGRQAFPTGEAAEGVGEATDGATPDGAPRRRSILARRQELPFRVTRFSAEIHRTVLLRRRGATSHLHRLEPNLSNQVSAAPSRLGACATGRLAAPMRAGDMSTLRVDVRSGLRSSDGGHRPNPRIRRSTVRQGTAAGTRPRRTAPEVPRQRRLTAGTAADIPVAPGIELVLVGNRKVGDRGRGRRCRPKGRLSTAWRSEFGFGSQGSPLGIRDGAFASNA